MGTHKDLLVYQKSMDLVVLAYGLIKKFPSEEKFALSNQLHRALVSIPSNISEGSQRQSKKELLQFLYISYGSLAESETQFELAARLGYISNQDYHLVSEKIVEISKMLRSYIRKVEVGFD